MYCSGCGTEIVLGAKFCANCGIQAIADLQTTQQPSSKTTLRTAINSAGEAMNRTAKRVGNVVNTVATQVGDLNGDGKVDEEDLKIATAKAKNAAVAASDEVKKLGKEALQNDLVKDAAAGAAVGAVVAVPVPLIGPIGGAAVGAALGVYKNLTKKK